MTDDKSLSRMPLVSVIVPLYNKEKYVRRALDSVLAQTFKEFELIIVNDGSTDNSPAVVREYDEPRIRLIDQENRGVSAARNRGIAEAKGELIAFLDADDEWLCDFLATIVHLEERFPEAGAYATGFRLLKDGKRIFRDLHIQSSRDECGCYFDLVRKGGTVNSSCIAIRSCVFDHAGVFRENYSSGEDLDLWFRIGIRYKFAVSPRICSLYYYSVPDNACHTTVPRGTHPLYASFLEAQAEKAVHPTMRQKAARYLSCYLAQDANRVLITHGREAARQRLCDYRSLFGLNRSYIKLLIVSACPIGLPRTGLRMRLWARRYLLLFKPVRSQDEDR